MPRLKGGGWRARQGADRHTASVSGKGRTALAERLLRTKARQVIGFLHRTTKKRIGRLGESQVTRITAPAFVDTAMTGVVKGQGVGGGE